jgi:hypothetical protein
VRTGSMIGVTKVRIGKLKPKHDAQVDEKYLWDSLHPIMPYPTGRFFRGTLFQALRARLRSGLSLRDTALSAEMSKLQTQGESSVSVYFSSIVLASLHSEEPSDIPG